MKFINPAYLINIRKVVNDLGDIEETEDKTKVFVYEQSIRQSEFWQAQAVGFKAEITLILRTFEYNGQEIIVYKNIRYKVYRTYDKNDGTIELMLIRGVNNGST